MPTEIININNFFHLDLTVDNTNITVDSTGYTADQTFIETDMLFIKIIPRKYPTTVTLEFYHEMKQSTFIETCFTQSKDGYMSIPFNYKEFEEGDSFELTVRDEDEKIIWRGKAYVTMSDDLQNFKLNVKTGPNNNKIVL